MIRAAALAPLLALALLPSPAGAAPAITPEELDVRVEAVRGTLRVSADLSAAFPPELERQLGNGLTNVVALHVAIVPARGGGALAIFPREVEVLYDVWEETFLVTVRDPTTPRGRRVSLATWAQLKALLGDLSGVPLGPIQALGDGAWAVQVRVELNPISKELLERTRELIADPTAGSRSGPSRSVLGAMAGYLLRAEPGTHVRVFRSDPFQAREVARR
ncbi:MAG TPA: hypothetical protein VFK85_14670 [Anaeromyxobacteraceae bacterium]|nr:hypothetical protein [Anaeromyxobacteraceae bacterium]